MMRVMLTQACRGGHPIDEVDSQSFKANRPVLEDSCCRLGFTQHHTPPLTRPEEPPPALERRPTERHRSTCHTLPPTIRPHSQPHQLHPAETPPREKLRLAP
jgi:hypothetical protein